MKGIVFLAPSREATAIRFLQKMQKGKIQVHINLWNSWTSPYEKKLQELFSPLGKTILLRFDSKDHITASRKILRDRKYDCIVLHGGDPIEIEKRILEYEIDYYINWVVKNSILFASQNAVEVLMNMNIVPTVKYLEHWNIYENDANRYDKKVHGFPDNCDCPVEEYINTRVEGDLYLTCDYSYFVYQHNRIKAFGRMYLRQNDVWYKIDCRGRTGRIDTPFTR